MKTSSRTRLWTVLAVFVFVLTLALATMAHAYGGGGGGDSDSGGGSDDAFDPSPDPGGGSSGGGGEGFGASPKAVAAWEAAGGRKGTGMSFQSWFSKQRADWETRQNQLTWDAKKDGWKASAWSIPYWGATITDAAGKAAQFGLNFVPGMGWVSVGLDTARGTAEGYGQAIDKGMSQADAAKVGAKTGTAQGLMSAGFNKFGVGNKFNYDKAVKGVQAAKTAKQIARSNKKLGKAIAGTIVDEGVQEGVGSQHTTNVVNSAAPTNQ